MFEEEDILETGIFLRMETYKALNRELTIKNQELRQYGSALREELCDVRRRLMEERTSQTTLKKAVISIITESFNRILCLLYENEADKQFMENGLASGDTSQRENSEDSRNNRRNSHLTRTSKGQNSPPPRKSLVDSNVVVRSPLVQIQNNNVTVRNRRAKPKENSKDLIQDAEDSEEGVDILDRAEHQLEVNNSSEAENENSISYPMPLPVVIEETSSKMDMSSITNQRGLRVFQLKLSTSTETTGKTLMPDLSENNEKSSQSRVMRSPLTGSGDSRSSRQILNSLTVPDIHFNESSFNNSSMLKAPSSTPYKDKNNKSDEKSQRYLQVLIPKLKQSCLSRYGITRSSIEDTHSQQNISTPKPSTSKTRKRNCVKNISPQIENEPQSNKSSPRRRPKRKAAEAAKSNLVEPTLNVKLRRRT